MSEVDTHLELAVRLGYLTVEQHSKLLDQLAEVGKLLNGLMRSLNK
jgi:four helix bundle protein